MNFLSADVLKWIWAGYAAVALFLGLATLLRAPGFRGQARNAWILITAMGGAVFVVSLLNDFGPTEGVQLSWIFSAIGETDLKIGARVDYFAGWSLGFLMLVAGARAFSSPTHPYQAAGLGIATAGWIIAWASQSLWFALLGWSLLMGSALLMRSGLVAEEEVAAEGFARDLGRVSAFLLLLWMTALGLEAGGFAMDFRGLPGDGSPTEIKLALYFLALASLFIPWTNASTLLRNEERSESDSLIVTQILVPLSICAAILRWSTGLESSNWVQASGFGTAALTAFFFLGYLASKKPIERLRALGVMTSGLIFASLLLFPVWCALLFGFGIAAPVVLLAVGFRGQPSAMRKTALLVALAVAVGVPGFLPQVFLHRLWVELPEKSFEAGALLFVHALFAIALLREVGTRFFSQEIEGESVDGTRGTLHFLLLIFVMAIWMTGSWTGGLLDAEYDRLGAFQNLSWVNDFEQWQSSVQDLGSFAEGAWIQLAVAALWLSLLAIFRGGRDPFLTEEKSWGAFRKGESEDFGIRWVTRHLEFALSWVGRVLEERIFRPIWETYLPAMNVGVRRAQRKAFAWVETRMDRLTDERWAKVVEAPSLLVQAVTNGKSQWYLFFTILGTFVLVLHFVIKLT